MALEDLKKHLFQRSRVEPMEVLALQAKAGASEDVRNARDAEPQKIYSVRKLPPKLSGSEAIGQAGALADAAVENGSQEPDGKAPEDQLPSPPSGLANAVMSYVEQSESSEYHVYQAVTSVFDQTKESCRQLSELPRMYEPVEAIGQTIGAVFAQLEAFRQQLTKFAQTFEAVKPLRQQIEQLTGAFQAHLAMLMKTLEPAEELRVRILQLAEAFEPLATLQEKFGQLHDAFGVPAPESGTDEGTTDPPATNQSRKGGSAGSAVMFYVDKSS
jgi:hypothetical protein